LQYKGLNGLIPVDKATERAAHLFYLSSFNSLGMNTYDISRNFWNWAFDNPEKISPNHAAIYFFAIEHCNRLGDREKFGFPTMMVCDAIGIKKASTYIRYFNDLIEWGFIDLIQKSSNQYSANIICLTSALPKKVKALDKAIMNHRDKQTENMGISNGPVDKPLNNITTKPFIKGINRSFDHLSITNDEFNKLTQIYSTSDVNEILDDIKNYSKNKQYKSLYLTANKWLKKNKKEIVKQTSNNAHYFQS